MKIERFFSLICVLLIAGALFSACHRVENSPETPVENATESASSPGGSSSGEGQVEVTTSQSQSSTGGSTITEQSTTIDLDASNYAYSVKKITASEDVELVLSITNTQGIHDFVIDELGVSSGPLPLGEAMSIAIPTDKPGTYEYYCSVGNHRELGMVGTLIIR